jgi:hypothetical protein
MSLQKDQLTLGNAVVELEIGTRDRPAYAPIINKIVMLLSNIAITLIAPSRSLDHRRLSRSQLTRLNSPQPILTLIFQPSSHEVGEINTDLVQQGSVFVHNVKTFMPDRSAPLNTTKLTAEQGIEAVEVCLRPSDARTGHHAGEALLVDADGVFDQGEVDEGDLEDVKWQITLKDTGPIRYKLVRQNSRKY